MKNTLREDSFDIDCKKPNIKLSLLRIAKLFFFLNIVAISFYNIWCVGSLLVD